MAYKRSHLIMKKRILLSLAILLSIHCFAQDELGYYSFSKKTDDGFVKFIAAPSSYVTIAKGSGLSEPFLPMRMNYMSLESGGKVVKEQYTLNFALISYAELNISDGGRLLLKYKDGETLTLATVEAFESDYSSGKYYVHPEYVITKEQIDTILNNGIVKLRFETLYKNIDVEPVDDRIMVHFKDKINGIEERKKDKTDTFSSGF